MTIEPEPIRRLSGIELNESLESELLFFVLYSKYEDDIEDSATRAQIESLIRDNSRWRLHWDSLKSFELEREAALQDGEDIERQNSRDEEPTEFCQIVAQTQGEVLVNDEVRQREAAKFSEEDWEQHLDDCAYCRRMIRIALAQAFRSQHADVLKDNEPLLRDWLLEEFYQEALKVRTQWIVGKTPTLQIPFDRDEGFIAVRSGETYRFKEKPKGRINGWDYVVFGAAFPELGLDAHATPAVVMAPRPVMVLDDNEQANQETLVGVKFQKVLGENYGMFAVWLRMKQNRSLEAELLASAQNQPLSVVLKVNGQEELRSGKEKKIEWYKMYSSVDTFEHGEIQIEIFNENDIKLEHLSFEFPTV